MSVQKTGHAGRLNLWRCICRAEKIGLYPKGREKPTIGF